MKTNSTKQLKLILLLITLTNLSYSQKFTYFPLSVGNKWFFSMGNDERIVTKFEVEKDTLLDDGKLYSKINSYYTSTPDLGIFTNFNQTIFLKKENNVILKYPNKILLDFDMNINDSANVIENSNQKQVLSSIYFSNVFGRLLPTYHFLSTEYDYSTYSDSIGFNTLHATTYANWVPQYLLGCVIDNKVYGKVITGIKTYYENNYIFDIYKNKNNIIKIKYSIPTSENVSIKLFDLRGKEIATIVNKIIQSENINEVEINVSEYQKGIYLCELKTDNYITTKKLLLY